MWQPRSRAGHCASTPHRPSFQKSDRIPLIAETVVVLLLLAALMAAHPVYAQDGGPSCPGGFVWERMSGVGCVQTDCLTVSNAKYNSEQRCICLDGYKPCYGEVDYSGFDPANCAIYCPRSSLVACVASHAACPNEVPPGQTEALSGDELLRDLEQFVAGQPVSPPSAAEAAAGGIALSTILTTWVLNKLLSGVAPKDVLTAISRWRSGQRAPVPDPNHATATAEATIDTEASAPSRKSPTIARTPPQVDTSDQAQALGPHIPTTSSAPPPELLEDRIRRKVNQTGDYVGAGEKTRLEFQERLKALPPELRNHELWKQKVQPQIDKVLKTTDPAKAKSILDRIIRILDADVRRRWDRDLRHVPAELREGGVWLERGLSELGKITGDLYKRTVTDPAKAAVRHLPPAQRAQAERAIDEQQKKIEQVLEGIPRAVRRFGKVITGGKQMNNQMDQIREGNERRYEDLQKMRHNTVRPEDRFDLSKGWRKVEAAKQWIGERTDRFWKWFSRTRVVPVKFYDIDID